MILDGGVTVGAIVVVNSAGEAFDTATGLPWMAEYRREFGLVDPPADQIAAYAGRHQELSPLNTTIAVVATDAALSPAGCRRVAVAAHDGLARTLRPCHTHSTGIRCSHWPPVPSRCLPTPPHRRRCHPRCR